MTLSCFELSWYLTNNSL